MPDKNQYNSPGWRGRLENIGEIPGEPTFQKNMAWDKLSARLEQPVQKKSRMIWWYAAAAVIAGFCMIMMWVSPADRQGQPLSSKETHQAAKPVLPEPQTTAPAMALPGEKKSADPVTAFRKTTPGPQVKPKQAALSAAGVSETLTQLNPATIQLVSITPEREQKDTLLLANSPEQVKPKKMAIVYLNEIEAVPIQNFTRNSPPKKRSPRLQKSIQTGTDDVFVASEPKRFMINLSSAN